MSCSNSLTTQVYTLIRARSPFVKCEFRKEFAYSRHLWLCSHLVPGSGVWVGYSLFTVMRKHRFYEYPTQNSGTMPVPKYNKVKNLYSSREVGTVVDSLCAPVFASSEAIHFFSQPLLPAKFAF